MWWGALGCQGAGARRQQLRSLNPLDRAEAVVQASSSRDLQAVAKLVDLLDDPDGAVRMFAILALRRLCGQDFDYHYYEDAPAREAAVERWREALRTGTLAVRPDSAQEAADELPTTSPAAP